MMRCFTGVAGGAVRLALVAAVAVASQLSHLPAALAQSAGFTLSRGTVVALVGTPHLWLADDAGVLHWVADTRALSARPAQWRRRLSVTPEALAELPLGDPLLSEELLTMGGATFAPKWETDQSAPRLLKLPPAPEIAFFGFSAAAMGHALDQATWEQRYGLSVAALPTADFDVGPLRGLPAPAALAQPASSPAPAAPVVPAPAAAAPALAPAAAAAPARPAAWSAATLSVARTGMAVAAVAAGDARYAIFAGGTTGSVQPTTAVDIFESTSGTWSTAVLSEAAAAPTAAIVGTKVLFVTSGHADIFDAAANRWSSAPLSVPRTGATVRVVGRKVLIAAGQALVQGAGQRSDRDEVDIYDDSTGHWSTAHLSSAPAPGSLIAFVGGTTVFFRDPGASADLLDMYHAESGEWTTHRLSQPRFSVSITNAGAKVLFAGGRTSPPGQTAEYSDVVDVYDRVTGEWSTAALAEPRQVGAARLIGTRAVFIGSVQGASDDQLTAVDIYHTTTGQWSSARLSAPRSVVGSAIVANGRELIIAGGVTNTPSAAVDIYDTATDTWRTARLSAPQRDAAVVGRGTKVILAGQSNPAAPASDAVAVYDVATGRWEYPKLSAPRRGLRSAATRNRVLFVAGLGDSSEVDTVDIYDIDADQWRVGKLSEARKGMAVATVGSKILIAGGLFPTSAGGSAWSDVVDIYDASAPLTP